MTEKNELSKAAVVVVDMFDQANTGGAIEKLGSRGQLLKKAIRLLRRTLNLEDQQTMLSEEQAE